MNKFDRISSNKILKSLFFLILSGILATTIPSNANAKACWTDEDCYNQGGSCIRYFLLAGICRDDSSASTAPKPANKPVVKPHQ